MKKLERLTLKELGDSVEVLDRNATFGLKGGDDGQAAYYLIYGQQLPYGTGYDVATNTCYSLASLPGPYDYQTPVPSSAVTKSPAKISNAFFPGSSL